MRFKWILFVDIVTGIWLCMFILTFFLSEEIKRIFDIILLSMLFIYLIDLVFIYKNSKRKNFFKDHWFDIVVVIPYFRLFRFLKFIRFLKMARISKGTKAIKGSERVNDKGVEKVFKGFIKMRKLIKRFRWLK